MGFKVIIVGGSISGLSLANMLERFGIDYVLLEGHSVIAPQLGASIGLLPAGLRILDQLGCYETIRELAGNTYYTASMRLFSGKIWKDTQPVTFSEKLEERVGYPQIFVDRKTVIQVLFDKLQHKDRVLTDKRVNLIELVQDRVNVHTKDGSVYTGDIVVGADGVHSAVRGEMWRIAQEEKSDHFKPDELSGLQCESKCIFGISKRPDCLPASPAQMNAFFKNGNYMILTAPGDRLYWFLFTEAERTRGGDIPRYTKEEERELAELHFGDRVTETMTFRDVYENRLQTTLASMEDHVFRRWHYRRIITIGDAAHKVHPISAQGGNGAMETAAVLVNALRRELEKTHSEGRAELAEADIEAVFAEAQEKRFGRAEGAVSQGRHTNSASIKETLFSKVFVDYFFPRYGQSLIFSLIVKNTASGPVVEGIPVPPRYEAAVARHEAAQKGKGPSWTLWSMLTLGAGLLTAVCYSALGPAWPGLSLAWTQ
ncbi:FAD binding domain-containing protein [Colletotrichum higginsianum IMI 349063]|uniref:FAD binding domain-containing protein n=2 Tax=Colletotrichum higginsianum TaxID=80884 RepID=A0A1B7XZT9_COLHI|nr:FAD binding domain-containing protein [Colletotrichum higginsianum IMI 349063]OBR05279.1 FAD binding domain-containing protein [Colletotrichum higginsianum IMI 349063]TIC93465.1 FAD-dependent monooxygenase atmM [Colletotrichum higginsianum]